MLIKFWKVGQVFTFYMINIFADAEEEKKKEEWREAAKKELEDWYKHHLESISKTKATNR